MSRTIRCHTVLSAIATGRSSTFIPVSREMVSGKTKHIKMSEQPSSQARAVMTGALFLGDKAENSDMFIKMAVEAFNSHIQYRKSYFPSDPHFVTDEMRGTPCFQQTVEKMRGKFAEMLTELHGSVPRTSTRNKGHMVRDALIPANLGLIAALLYNQNNHAIEGSPVTTRYEMEVGRDLCTMLGYDPSKSMGHLVAGGSVANVEALWAARNLKFFPLGLSDAVKNEKALEKARGLQIFLPHKNEHALLGDVTNWELLNLDVDDMLGMPDKIASLCGISESALASLLVEYTYDSIGALEFYQRHGLTNSPCYLVAASAHTSIFRASTIIGIGKRNMVQVPLDDHGRMDTKGLRVLLEDKLQHQIPVICVVAIMGTTEESAVDPLTDILRIRQEMRQKGLNFAVHADAAWGGYFCTMLRTPSEHSSNHGNQSYPWFVPELALSTYTHTQLSAISHADTITIDPQKSGFCAYPAGGICYRDKRLNGLLGNKKVDYYHGAVRLGDIGIEGSKPGTAAAAVAMAHRVVSLDRNGYGHILAECMFTSKMFYCMWLCLATDDDPFFVVPTTPLPPDRTRDQHIMYMRENIIGKTNAAIAQNEDAMEYLRQIGPDTSVVSFTWNIHGNSDVTLVNRMVENVFNVLCMAGDQTSPDKCPMLVTSSTHNPNGNGASLAKLKNRLGLDVTDRTGVKYVKTSCLDATITTISTLKEMEVIMRSAILKAIEAVR